MKQVMRRMGLDTKQLTPRTVLGRISWAKNHMVDPQEYYLAQRIPTASALRTSSTATRRSCARTTRMDFDDLLLEAVRLLKVSSEVRERYQRRYRYLLVDEYQDTNRPQYELMKLLAGERRTCAQWATRTRASIRGAARISATFWSSKRIFPTRRIVRLEQNYRSTQNILEAAGAVVANNIRRKGKKLWTDARVDR